MPETTGTTRPAPRKRATPAAKAETPKPATTTPKAPRKAVPATPDAVMQTEEDGREVYVFDLVHERDTRTYSVWKPPTDSACVGSLYAPLGAHAVRVKMTGGPTA